MAEVSILGSTCTGHGDWPPRANAEGEPLHTINGVPVHCQGHKWLPHASLSSSETHDGVTTSGASRHTINGTPLACVGDSISCGSKIATGQGLHTVD